MKSVWTRTAALLIVILVAGCATPFSKYTSYAVYNVWEYDSSQEKEPAEQLTVSFEGMQITVSYSSTVFRGWQSFRSHEYWSEDGKRFHIHSGTGEVHSYFDIGYDREAEALKEMPEDPKAYTRELAITLAKKYVDTRDYKLELMNPDASEDTIGYIYCFTKYVSGLPTRDFV